MDNRRREQLQLSAISRVILVFMDTAWGMFQTRSVLVPFETSRPAALLLAGQLPDRDAQCHAER